MYMSVMIQFILALDIVTLIAGRKLDTAMIQVSPKPMVLDNLDSGLV
jgi:hypothetical protein